MGYYVLHSLWPDYHYSKTYCTNFQVANNHLAVLLRMTVAVIPLLLYMPSWLDNFTFHLHLLGWDGSSRFLQNVVNHLPNLVTVIPQNNTVSLF